ncbi:MAG: hypothetical protein WCL13_02380 [bacterium]
MIGNNEGIKCAYLKKGCLTSGPGCTTDQMKDCETAKLWSLADSQKCPVLNFKDECDIQDLRRLMLADAGECCNNGECLRKLYPEINEQISQKPDLKAIAKNIQRKRLQNKLGLGNTAEKQCCLDLATAT